MTMKYLSLQEIVSKHTNDHGDLETQLNNLVFTKIRDDIEYISLVRRLIYFTLYYSYDDDMFKVLSKYALNHLRNFKVSEPWFITMPVDSVGMNTEKVTEFLFDLFPYRGVINPMRIHVCSEEYQMFMAL